MPAAVALTSNHKTWPADPRVCRRDTREFGTVIEIGVQIKVRWDGGKTSYFRCGQESNVQLEPFGTRRPAPLVRPRGSRTSKRFG